VLSYPASFGSETKIIEISPVMGTGTEATWFVFIDRYFHGSVTRVGGELVYHPGAGIALQGDDVGALLEVVEMDTNKESG
jgi:hypothetical protein